MSFLQTVQNPMCIIINHVILLKKCICITVYRQICLIEFHPTDFVDQDHDTIEQITDYLYMSNITAISKGDMLFYFLQT